MQAVDFSFDTFCRGRRRLADEWQDEMRRLLLLLRPVRVESWVDTLQALASTSKPVITLLSTTVFHISMQFLRFLHLPRCLLVLWVGRVLFRNVCREGARNLASTSSAPAMVEGCSIAPAAVSFAHPHQMRWLFRFVVLLLA